MLNKRDIEQFYEEIVKLYTISNQIKKNNAALELKYDLRNPNTKKEKSKIVNQLLLKIKEPEYRFLVSYMSSPELKLLLISLLLLMNKYNFSKISSIPSNRESVVAEKQTRYDKLSKIDLKRHTIDCAICAIEICEKENQPQSMMELTIILAILHDFGKCPKIAEEYKEKNFSKHHQISSLFAKKFLKKFVDVAIAKETYEQIHKSIMESHYAKNVGTLTTLLKKADFCAREKELSFMELEENKSKEIKDDC